MAEKEKIENKNEERLVRILSKDLEGKKRIYPALTKIKGVSWTISNFVCKKTNIEKNTKVANLSKEEIEKIENFLKKLEAPSYIKNRQKDLESGKDNHLISSDLELRNEFDIKRLKKIKSYRGFRHIAGLPTRGQRTKSNFRKNKSKGAGIKKKK